MGRAKTEEPKSRAGVGFMVGGRNPHPHQLGDAVGDARMYGMLGAL